MIDIPRIVLTGGPGGGKTTLMRELRSEDPERNRYILVPEAATILIRAGHLPGTKEFQLAVVNIQRTLEQACAGLARPGQVLICDRSTVDSLAYWLLMGGTREEFFVATGICEEDHYARYAGAIHLQTAAIGAEGHYEQIGEGARMEGAEEAAKIDDLCAQVWRKHPKFRMIENRGEGWREKSNRAKEALDQLLG